MNIHFSTAPKGLTKDLVRVISEKIFIFFLFLYIVLYLLELLLPGVVAFALNLQFFFYASLVSGLIYILQNNKVDVTEQAERHFSYLQTKDYFLSILSGIVTFIFSLHVLVGVGSFKVIFSLLVGLAVSITVLYMRSEKKVIKRAPPDSMERSIHKWSKYLFFIFFIFTFGYIFYVNTVPSGTLSYKIKPEKNNRNVLSYTTEGDILIGEGSDGGQYRLAMKNPVELSLRIPRKFQSADVKITYAPTKGDTSIRLGTKNIYDGVSYKDLVNFDLFLENLPQYWQEVRSGDLVVWEKNGAYKTAYDEMQSKVEEANFSYNVAKNFIVTEHQEGLLDDEYSQKLKNLNNNHTAEVNLIISSYQEQYENFKPTYSSTSDFLTHIKDVYNQAIGYHFPLENYFSIDSSETPSSAYDQNTSMRGSYTYYIYQDKEGPIHATVTARDSNKHDGEDLIRLTIFKDSEKVIEELYPDDNNVLGNNKITDSRTYSITTGTLKPGMYKFLFETTYDVFTTHVNISSPYVAFQNVLHVTDSYQYPGIINSTFLLPVVIYTNSTKIRYSTAHSQSLQTILINDESVPINEVQVWQQKDSLPKVTKIVIPKGDVKFRGDGLFTFDQNSPLLNYLPASNNGLVEGYLNTMNYIVANYPRPQREGEWLVAEGSVNAPDIGFNHNKAEFLLDFGNLSLDSKTVKIKSIDVKLTKEPLTFSRVFQKIKDVF